MSEVMYYTNNGFVSRQEMALNDGDKCPTCDNEYRKMVHYMDGLVWCPPCGTTRRTVGSVLKYN